MGQYSSEIAKEDGQLPNTNSAFADIINLSWEGLLGKGLVKHKQVCALLGENNWQDTDEKWSYVLPI